MLTKPPTVTHRWRHTARSIPLARAELRKALADWHLTAIEDDSLVVLSELLTNAVVHARVPRDRRIETRFEHPVRDTVRICVDDADPTHPHPGRGLSLVAALSSSWGVSGRNGVGKRVWAVLRAERSE
ncbi:ATP-binding protein [Streptomyces sp. NPDC049555]|uniref:ATP-binding protein n=1 Tax=unclassified Streptomyces TaxID=2593676 RepID=UPI00342ADC70